MQRDLRVCRPLSFRLASERSPLQSIVKAHSEAKTKDLESTQGVLVA